MTIKLFELLGLATDVVVAPPSKQRDGYSPDGLLLRVSFEWALSLLLASAVWWVPHQWSRWTGRSSCGTAKSGRQRVADGAPASSGVETVAPQDWLGSGLKQL